MAAYCPVAIQRSIGAGLCLAEASARGGLVLNNEIRMTVRIRKVAARCQVEMVRRRVCRAQRAKKQRGKVPSKHPAFLTALFCIFWLTETTGHEGKTVCVDVSQPRKHRSRESSVKKLWSKFLFPAHLARPADFAEERQSIPPINEVERIDGTSPGSPMNAHVSLLALMTASFMFIWHHDQPAALRVSPMTNLDETMTSVVPPRILDGQPIRSHVSSMSVLDLAPGTWNVTCPDGGVMRITVELLPASKSKRMSSTLEQHQQRVH